MPAGTKRALHPPDLPAICFSVRPLGASGSWIKVTTGDKRGVSGSFQAIPQDPSGVSKRQKEARSLRTALSIVRPAWYLHPVDDEEKIQPSGSRSFVRLLIRG
jgi:hypothetical protein